MHNVIFTASKGIMYSLHHACIILCYLLHASFDTRGRGQGAGYNLCACAISYRTILPYRTVWLRLVWIVGRGRVFPCTKFDGSIIKKMAVLVQNYNKPTS